MKKIIIGKKIEIKGLLARHKIVRKVVTHFITAEYSKKGKGITFRYPVEDLPGGKLFIARPGHKKNFDFKVAIELDFNVGEGSHIEIAKDLRKKKEENRGRFEDFLNALSEIYNCSENDVDKILEKYPDLDKSFHKGTKIDVLLKIIKWLFIMEDIVYWDNEGRAFLFNFLIYVAKEKNMRRLNLALETIKNPDRLKTFMKKCGIEWIRCKE